MAGPLRYWRLVLAFAAALPAAETPAPRKLHVMMAMRDGVRLSTHIFLPPGPPGRVPVVLERTPYGKAAEAAPNYSTFLEHGYAVVVQDVRGRYASEGAFDPLRQEGPDGDDTLNWIARQQWSDGKVGMIGGSYRGIVQWKAALSGNPHLKAIFPIVSGYDDYRDRYYSTGGAMKLGHRLGWMSENLKAPGLPAGFQPLRAAPAAAHCGCRAATGWPSQMYRDVIAHPSYDQFWRAISVRERLDRVKAPVFAVGGWYDNYVQSDLEAFAALRKSSGVNRVLVGPWAHSMSYVFPEADFGPDSGATIRDTAARVVRPMAEGPRYGAAFHRRQ